MEFRERASRVKKTPWPCVVCGKECRATCTKKLNVRSVECSVCSGWSHEVCSSLTPDAFDYFEKWESASESVFQEPVVLPVRFTSGRMSPGSSMTSRASSQPRVNRCSTRCSGQLVCRRAMMSLHWMQSWTVCVLACFHQLRLSLFVTLIGNCSSWNFCFEFFNVWNNISYSIEFSCTCV